MFETTLKLPKRVVRIHPRPIKSGFLAPMEESYVTGIPDSPSENGQLLPQEIQEREEKAYQFGFEDGKKLAMQEVQENLSSSLQAFEESIRSFQQAESAMYRDNEPVIFELAVGIAGRILKKEIQQEPELIRTVAEEAVRLVEDKHRLLIRTNAEHLRILRDYANESLAELQGIDNVEIVEDARVEPGGCIVESQSGIVDAQIKTQLSEIYDHLVDSTTRKQVA